MTKKTSFNLDKAISRITRPSIFDQLVKEVEAKEIPVKYIESIVVQYHDGHIVELSGAELTHPIPMSKNVSTTSVEEAFKKMKDIKVYLDTSILEIDINIMVENLIGKYC